MPLSNHSSSASSVDSMSSEMTPVSSIFDVDLATKERQWSTVNQQLKGLVEALLSEKRENETLLRAWNLRSQSLEHEVQRLQRLVLDLETRLEYKRQELTALEGLQSLGIGSDDTPRRQEIGVATAEEDFIKTRPAPKNKWIGDWRLGEPSTRNRPATPKIDPTKSMSKQNPPPCNSYYLVGTCNVPKCRFSHLYKLTPDQIEEIRRGARFHPCNSLKNGLECTDPTCCYGHTCPRGTACGRVNCAFTDAQHVGPPLKSTLTSMNKRLAL